MTIFIHKPDVDEEIKRATSALGSSSSEDKLANLRKQQILDKLRKMLEFASGNLDEMLNAMGFNSIEELNNALNNYNNINLSMSQLFPAFSDPQISEILLKSGIDKKAVDLDYGLITSAIQDQIYRSFQNQVQQGLTNEDLNQEVHRLMTPNMANAIAANICAQLFGGITISDGLYADLLNGKVRIGDGLSRLVNEIGKAAKSNNFTSTNIRTLDPFFAMLSQFLQQESQTIIDENNYETIEKVLKSYINKGTYTVGATSNSKPKAITKDIIKRTGRGNKTITSSVKVTSKEMTNGMQFMIYLDTLKVDLDPTLFNLQKRGKDSEGKDLSIEKYVNETCKKYPEIYTQLKKNIVNFYWSTIEYCFPIGIQNPLTKDEFSLIIDHMTSLSENSYGNTGNIGWFFSQSSSKALGSGMFGEIAAIIYMRLLCPKLNLDKALEWAGGVTKGQKPAADVIVRDVFGKPYGLQVKNYTTGTTLSAGYNIAIKEIMEAGSIAAQNNLDDDLMTMQTMSELGISREEIESIQNIIISKVFNVEYQKIGDVFYEEENITFQETRKELLSLYSKATKYMALISVISHRLQYTEEINRQIDKNESKIQLQNTLWLINGKAFVSSVQILQELIAYVETEIEKFFNVYASFRVTHDDAKKYGLPEGKMTIVNYLNMNPSALGQSSAQAVLKGVTATIGTNYKMSAFMG